MLEPNTCQASYRRPVSIRYKGMLTSGVPFDSNMPRGRPLKFVIGGGDVIAGLEQGVQGMREGGYRNILIPSSLGYGSVPQQKIPANSDLIFEVELLTAGTAVSQRLEPKGQTEKQIRLFEKRKQQELQRNLFKNKNKGKGGGKGGKKRSKKKDKNANTVSFMTE